MTKPAIDIDHSIAWNNYKSTLDYKTSIAMLKNKGILQPYADNMLRYAFDAAWNAKNYTS